MRVLIANSLYDPNIKGGAEFSTRTLVQGLADRQMEVAVVSCAPDGCFRKEQSGKVTKFYLPIANIGNPYGQGPQSKLASKLVRAGMLTLDSFNPLMMSSVRQIIREMRPSLVHTNNLFGLSASFWSAAATEGVPITHTLRDHYLRCAHSVRYSSSGVCSKTCASCAIWSVPRRSASGRVGAVVGISRFILDSHLDHGYFSRALATVIPNAVDVPVTSARQYPGSKSLRIGYLGQLAPIKGLDLLLEAFVRLPQGRFSLEIGGVGDARYVTPLMDRYRNVSITWRGKVQADRFLDEIDVLVVPSIWEEPAGRVVLEAYARGVPVLASERGGLPEMIGMSGAGQLFDPSGGPDLLAAKILGFTSSAEGLSAASRSAIAMAAAYDAGQMVSRYCELYEILLGRHG